MRRAPALAAGGGAAARGPGGSVPAGRRPDEQASPTSAATAHGSVSPIRKGMLRDARERRALLPAGGDSGSGSDADLTDGRRGLWISASVGVEYAPGTAANIIAHLAASAVRNCTWCVAGPRAPAGARRASRATPIAPVTPNHRIPFTTNREGSMIMPV